MRCLGKGTSLLAAVVVIAASTMAVTMAACTDSGTKQYVVILDGTDTVGWNDQKRFVAELLESMFATASTSSPEVGVVVMEDGGGTVLTTTTDTTTVPSTQVDALLTTRRATTAAIEAHTPAGGSAYVHAALTTAWALFPDGTSDPQTILFVISELAASSNPTAATQAARETQREGYTMYMVGYGFQGDSATLNGMATWPPREHAFSTSSSAGLWGAAFAPPVVAAVKGDAGFQCVAFGNLVYGTLDGNIYAFPGVGDFYLTYSDTHQFDVQVRQRPCVTGSNATNGLATNSSAVCITGVAVYDGVSKLAAEYDPRANVVTTTANGQMQAIQDISFSSGTASVVPHYQGGWHVTATFYNGNSVVVKFSPNGAAVWVTPNPGLAGRISGLCGFYDGCGTNDFQTPNGTVISSDATGPGLYSAFGLSWGVQYEDSIFPRSTGYWTAPYTQWQPVFAASPAADQVADVTQACHHVPTGMTAACHASAGLVGSADATWSSIDVAVTGCLDVCSAPAMGRAALALLDPSFCRCPFQIASLALAQQLWGEATCVCVCV